MQKGCGCRWCRRNYSSIFEEVMAEPALMRADGFVLRLIGRGDLAVPEALAGRVVKEPDLAYPVRSPPGIAFFPWAPCPRILLIPFVCLASCPHALSTAASGAAMHAAPAWGPAGVG